MRSFSCTPDASFSKCFSHTPDAIFSEKFLIQSRLAASVCLGYFFHYTPHVMFSEAF